MENHQNIQEISVGTIWNFGEVWEAVVMENHHFQFHFQSVFNRTIYRLEDAPQSKGWNSQQRLRDESSQKLDLCFNDRKLWSFERLYYKYDQISIIVYDYMIVYDSIW